MFQIGTAEPDLTGGVGAPASPPAYGLPAVTPLSHYREQIRIFRKPRGRPGCTATVEPSHRWSAWNPRQSRDGGGSRGGPHFHTWPSCVDYASASADMTCGGLRPRPRPSVHQRSRSFSSRDRLQEAGVRSGSPPPAAAPPGPSDTVHRRRHWPGAWVATPSPARGRHRARPVKRRRPSQSATWNRPESCAPGLADSPVPSSGFHDPHPVGPAQRGAGSPGPPLTAPQSTGPRRGQLAAENSCEKPVTRPPPPPLRRFAGSHLPLGAQPQQKIAACHSSSAQDCRFHQTASGQAP